jgi:hypothetical protein
VIWPTDPLQGTSQLTIRGNLHALAEHGLRAPRLSVAGTTASRRFLVLPIENESHRIEWDTGNLESASLPLEAGLISTERDAIYELHDARGNAVLRGIDEQAPQQRIRLADYSVDCGRGGFVEGIALFDLDSAGKLSCPLSVPSGCELTQAFIDGLPADLAPIQAGEWQMRLGPKRAPMRVQILFRCQLADGLPGRGQFKGPKLGDIAVDRTIWRVFANSEFRVLPMMGTPLSPLEHAMIRVRSAAGLVDILVDLADGGAAEEAARNFRPWTRRLRSARKGAERLLATDASAGASTGDAEMRAELNAIENDQKNIAMRLGATEVLQQVYAESLWANQPGQLWEELAPDSGWGAACLFDGPQSTFTCQLSSNWFSRPIWKSALLAFCLLSGVIVYRLPAQSRWLQHGNWAPWGAFAAFGILWWAGGVGPIMGLALCGLALFGMAATIIRAGQKHSSGSTEFEVASTLADSVVAKPR